MMNGGIQPTVELATNNGAYPYPVYYGNNDTEYNSDFINKYRNNISFIIYENSTLATNEIDTLVCSYICLFLTNLFNLGLL